MSEKGGARMNFIQRLLSIASICVGAYWLTFYRFFIGNASGVEQLFEQTAPRPYQYRILMPWIEGLVSRFLLRAHANPLPLYVSSQLRISNVIQAQVVFVF